MKPVIALAGQPNTGKSTLFNFLTGSRQHVGNWPGKTVEKKTGLFAHKGRTFEIIDLPGSYSLSANSPEEKITRDYILEEKPDCVVVTVDGSQLEWTLFMLAEVCQLPVPVLLAVTMVDIAAGLGEEIMPEKLAEMTGVAVVAVNVTKGYGLEEFMQAVENCLAAPPGIQRKNVFFHPLTRQLGEELDDLEFPVWSAGKLLEGDSDTFARLSAHYPAEKWQKVEQLLQSAPESAAEIARQKHLWIEQLVKSCRQKNTTARKKRRRHRFDTLATHPVFGKLLALSLIVFAFLLAFIVCLGAIMVLYSVIDSISCWIEQHLSFCPPWLISLLADLYFSSFLLRRFLPGSKTFELIMELPPYHPPNFKTISRYTWRFIQGFIRRGLPLITAVFMLVWFLSYFPDGNMETSWLAELGRFLNPIGSLMGMDWKLMVALIASIASKEAALAVLAVIYGMGEQASSINSLMFEQGAISQNLGDMMLANISPATALAFMFALFFSIPCIGTLGTLYAENNSLKWTVIAVCYYTLTSFVMGVLAYQTGLMIF